METLDRPVFVIGCPRSGTTMLQLMLHSHPRIAVPPETRFMIQAYHARRRHGDMRRPDNRRRLAEWVAGGKDTKFRELGLDRVEYVDHAVAAPGSLGSVLGTVFRDYAARFGKPRWGDKRPSYFKHVGMLLRLFPDAQFIHLVRDGRDCVASLMEMPWYKLDVYHAIANWAEAIDFGRHHAAHLPAGSYYELRYEDLTADPESSLKRLCGFIGEDYDPAMCEPRHVAQVAVPAHKVWHANTHTAVTTARSGSWSNRLEPWQISLCETVLGSRLEAHGYALSDAPRADRGHRTAYRTTAAKRRGARLKRVGRERLVRLWEPGPIPALLTSGQRELAGLLPLPHGQLVESS
ncbi:sulfotransferase family protein [Herbidospora yilanensis]|uniref:sulfotransferase family protein n=1 Tax=Herbidospora yilanensis TaxID=354426 RepID=UPI000785F154|nr:sulfotransferase [Herbidospora yilanensis]